MAGVGGCRRWDGRGRGTGRRRKIQQKEGEVEEGYTGLGTAKTVQFNLCTPVLTDSRTHVCMYATC